LSWKEFSLFPRYLCIRYIHLYVHFSLIIDICVGVSVVTATDPWGVKVERVEM
jgi:hypothetical protein